MIPKEEIEKAIQQTKEIAEREGLLDGLEPLEEADATLLDSVSSLFTTQPLFTLTIEEVEVVKASLYSSKNVLEKAAPTLERDIAIEDINEILNKITDFQNGKEI